jgi:hypothetical protein
MMARSFLAFASTVALGLGLAMTSSPAAARPHGRTKPPTHPPPAPAPTTTAPEPTPPPAAAPTPAAAPAAPTTPAASPSPTPAATPPPAPAPADNSAAVTAAAQSGEGADVDALRQEYLKLRDELFASRARAAAVASALYSTKITLKLAYTTGRFYNIRRATVRLDGANVFDDTEGKIAADDAVRFEGYVAPGRHLVTVRIEAAGKDDDRFTSATETTSVVVATGGKDLAVTAKASDGGDIPYAWKRGEHGTYDLRVAIDVKSVAPTTAPIAKPAGGGKGAGK